MNIDQWLKTEEGREVSFYPPQEMVRRAFAAGQRNAPKPKHKAKPPVKTEKVDPIKIILRYRKALLDLYGETIARTSTLYYNHGWYYINVARKFSDGSVGVGGTLASPHRLKEVLKMIINLEKRGVPDSGAK